MIIGSREFKDGTYVMAIINLTPDSFYAPSRKTRDNILYAVEKAVREGASVIDIGAQSTRPGYEEVSAEEEISRFYSPLLDIRRNFDIPVSVDTYYASAARAALECGADMINDVWGLTHDADMARVIADSNASVCIMHNSKTPVKGDLWENVLSFLKKSIGVALAAGVDKNKIIVDGGIGFAKSREQNLELLDGYEKLGALGYPSLLGCSRKSLFGGSPEDRLAPTVEASVRAYKKGVLFVRVHDVEPNVRAIRECTDAGQAPSNREAHLG